MAQFHCHFSDESYQYAIITATHIRILLQFILTKQMISPLLTTMWYHTDGCENQYSCASFICLLLFLDLELSIIIYIALGASVHVKYMVDGLNDRDKWLLQLAMEKLLNPGIIWDDPIFQVCVGS